jgi:hypothetical protein
MTRYEYERWIARQEIDRLLVEANRHIDSLPLPPEAHGVWYPFDVQKPTVEGMYLVFIRQKWNDSAEVCYAWYAPPPATPWLSHPREPYSPNSCCISGVTHWMILTPPTTFNPFLPRA